MPWRSPSLLLRTRLRTDAVKLRRTKEILNPYRILVSEVMLQQTQVPRVIGKYKSFLRKFPAVRALAKAPLSDVLKVWSGLGYNRRGKYLHDAARMIVEKHSGNVPLLYSELVELPGIGRYTASAIRVFAFNEPDVLIETNVRTVYIRHFLRHLPYVSDHDIKEYAERTAKGQDPRKWHWALMDYGAHLKRSGVRNNHHSTHYAKQSKFEGSIRQVRGAILRTLQNGQKTQENLMMEIRSPSLKKGLAGLTRDGLIVKEKRGWRIA